MPEITTADDDLEAEGLLLLSRLSKEGYEGARLEASPPTRRLLAALAREGFRVRHGGKGKGAPGKTVRVEWEESPGEFRYVAYSYCVSNLNEIKALCALLQAKGEP